MDNEMAPFWFDFIHSYSYVNITGIYLNLVSNFLFDFTSGEEEIR